MKEQLEKRLNEIENRIYWLEMADRMRPSERDEWYNLCDERARVRRELANMK